MMWTYVAMTKMQTTDNQQFAFYIKFKESGLNINV